MPDAINMKNNQRLLRIVEYSTAVILTSWLAATSFIINVEYHDGMDAILNIRSIFGEAPYNANRGPMMSILLFPAYYLSNGLLPDHDFRLYHISMAIYHTVYLILIYRMIIYFGGRNWASLLAFLLATTNYIFFSYSPFISHDILPGAIFLGMILLAHRFLVRPDYKTWIALVILGAAAALIKHILGMFWIVILASTSLAMLYGKPAPEYTWRKFSYLIYGAFASGLITWIVLAYVLGANASYANTEYLLRPYQQLNWLLYGAPGITEFPWWTYIRNIPAYGLGAVILLPFALYLSLNSGNSLYRISSISFLLMLTVMSLISIKEVRYLAPLSPLLAVLLIRPLKLLMQNNAGRFIIVLGLIFNVFPWNSYSIAKEAVKVFHPFYQTSPIERNFSYVTRQNFDVIIINWNLLSFSSGIPSPLVGDRYHGIFHIAGHHLSGFLGFDKNIVTLGPDGISKLLDWPDRTAIISSNGHVLTNKSEFFDKRNHYSGEPKQYLSVSRSASFNAINSNIFAADDGKSIEILSFDSRPNYFLKSNDLTEMFANGFNFILRFDNDESIFELVDRGQGLFEISGAGSGVDIKGTTHISLRWFETLASIH